MTPTEAPCSASTSRQTRPAAAGRGTSPARNRLRARGARRGCARPRRPRRRSGHAERGGERDHASEELRRPGGRCRGRGRKARSILIMSIGSALRYWKEPQPLPKSSSAILNPNALSLSASAAALVHVRGGRRLGDFEGHPRRLCAVRVHRGEDVAEERAVAERRAPRGSHGPSDPIAASSAARRSRSGRSSASGRGARRPARRCQAAGSWPSSVTRRTRSSSEDTSPVATRTIGCASVRSRPSASADTHELDDGRVIRRVFAVTTPRG